MAFLNNYKYFVWFVSSLKVEVVDVHTSKMICDMLLGQNER